MLVIKQLRDFLFLLIKVVVVLIELQLILAEDTSFQKKTENYKIEIGGRNFYDHPINDLIKQYDEVRKVSTWQSDDYTTGLFIQFCLFPKQLQTNCGWFNEKKALDVDSRPIQQIIFTGRANAGAMIYYILKQKKQYYNSLKVQQKVCE